MNLREKAILFLATGGYVGCMPFAPGTLGALMGLPLCFLLSRTGLWISALFLLLYIPLAVGICQKAEQLIQKEDPNSIILDEILGMTVSLTGLPFDVMPVAAGFIVFRLLDIFKPFPIRALEKRFSGGAGIILDDLAAGFFTNILLRAAFFISASPIKIST